MAAPTIAALLDYEANIEDAVATYLGTQMNAATQILTPRTLYSTAPNLKTPRITIAYQLSGTGMQEDKRTTDGLYYRNFKMGALTMAAVVQRDTTGQGSAKMTELRGGIRKAMLEATAALNGTTLPYYQVVNLIEGSSAMSSSDTNTEIICQLTYRLDFAILPNQWAAS